MRRFACLCGAIFLTTSFATPLFSAEFLKFKGTSVIMKVVGGADNVVATTEKGKGSKAFKLEVLRAYYVMEDTGDFYKIAEQQSATGRTGYVAKDKVLLWNSREGLHFSPSFLAGEHPTVKAWENRATIEQYAKTGNSKSFGHAYEEEDRISRGLPKNLLPYPVIESEMVETAMGSEKKIYKVLIPTFVEGAEVITNLSTKEIGDVVSSVTFCIIFDATGSMAPYALEMSEKVENLLKGIGQTDGLSAGFVFYRDSVDASPYQIFKPNRLDLSYKTLREEASNMSGGGDSAEPVLDAMVIAATEFDWGGGTAGQGAKKVAILIANADAKGQTIGLGKSVGRGMEVAEVASIVEGKGMRVYALQAGAEDGGRLKLTLAKLANQTGGEFYAYGDTSASASFGTAIQKYMKGSVSEAKAESKAIVSKAKSIPTDRDFTSLPLKALNPDIIARLKEASKKFEIKEGGLVVNDGWMFETSDMYEEQILVEKVMLEKLIAFFNLLADTGSSLEDMTKGVKENLEAMLGEDISADAEIQELIEKRLGIHFKTNLLAFPLEYLAGLTPKERVSISKRIQEASGKLSSFLEAKSGHFNKEPMAWMRLSYLP